MHALTVVAQVWPIDTGALAPLVRTWLVLALAAFVGGAFGAAVGALPALAFSGVLVVVGEAAALVDQALPSAVGVTGPGVLATGFTGTVALGPVFGPHVSFAGGAAAAAYATRKGDLDTEFEYYAAKHIARPLGARPAVLVVGGLFGILGLAVARLSADVVPGAAVMALPWDPIAFGVVLAAAFHRVVLGFPLVGRIRADGGVLDMSSFDPDAMRHTAMGSRIAVAGNVVADRFADVGRGEPDAGRAPGDGHTAARERTELAADPGHGGDAAAEIAPGSASGRLAVEPWQPRYYEWPVVAAIGGAVGVLAALVGLATGSALLPFGLSVASLFALVYGVEYVPVTHHVALPASTAALAVAGGAASLSIPALLVGTLFGLGGALVGEFAQRLLYAHGHTHFDPAAVAIVVTTFLIAVLAVLGVFPTSVLVPLAVAP